MRLPCPLIMHQVQNQRPGEAAKGVSPAGKRKRQPIIPPWNPHGEALGRGGKFFCGSAAEKEMVESGNVWVQRTAVERTQIVPPPGYDGAALHNCRNPCPAIGRLEKQIAVENPDDLRAGPGKDRQNIGYERDRPAE
jgi:hypothetical protein